MLRSDLYDYSDAYIVMKGRITVEDNILNNRANKNLIFKNTAPFRSCISKISNTFIENADDLDNVMPMYNLLECSDNYPMASRSLWNYYRDEGNDDANENNDASNYRINKNKATTSNSFEYKTKTIRKTPDIARRLDAVVPLKYLGNFWRFLDLPLISCEVELDLS